MKSLVALALLLAFVLTRAPGGVGACDHAGAMGGSSHHQAPVEQPEPCSHDQPGQPAGQCTAMVGCGLAPMVLAAPVAAFPVAGVVTAAVPADVHLRSYLAPQDVPPPRL
jgi:hypothetical protein